MSTPMSVEQYRDLILQDVAALPSAQLPLAQCLGAFTRLRAIISTACWMLQSTLMHQPVAMK